jgi:isopropylmalate/homocitrate/citramalate synthase
MSGTLPVPSCDAALRDGLQLTDTLLSTKRKVEMA